MKNLILVGGLAMLAISADLTAVAPTYVYLFPLNVLNAASQAAYAVVSLALMGDLLEQSDTNAQHPRPLRARTRGLARMIKPGPSWLPLNKRLISNTMKENDVQSNEVPL